MTENQKAAGKEKAYEWLQKQLGKYRHTYLFPMKVRAQFDKKVIKYGDFKLWGK